VDGEPILFEILDTCPKVRVWLTRLPNCVRNSSGEKTNRAVTGKRLPAFGTLTPLRVRPNSQTPTRRRLRSRSVYYQFESLFSRL